MMIYKRFWFWPLSQNSCTYPLYPTVESKWRWSAQLNELNSFAAFIWFDDSLFIIYAGSIEKSTLSTEILLIAFHMVYIHANIKFSLIHTPYICIYIQYTFVLNNSNNNNNNSLKEEYEITSDYLNWNYLKCALQFGVGRLF